MKFNTFVEVLAIYLFLVNFVELKSENDLDIEDRYVGLKQTFLDKEVDTYLGIPYAEPPIGDLRFRKPKPYKYEGGVINATEWPVSCHHEQFMGLEKLSNNKDVNEDCLYLNVWSPKKSKYALKPVMFFIHGGALLFGSSNWDGYSGEALAALGDVVVVTINYRLQSLGFLFTGTDDAPGNVGLWDQVLALQWVRDNIEHFGGDPNQVTIFGESAGGWSVSLHVLSPVSRGLFKNAIMMSGSALTHITGENPEKSIKKWLKIAKLAECGNGLEFKTEDIKCLRRIPAEKLIEIAAKPEFSDFSSFIPTVIYDNEFLPKRPIEMLENKDFKKDFSLLVSSTDDEGTFYLKHLPNINPVKVSKSEAIELLQQILPQIQSDVPINSEDVLKVYLSRLPPNKPELNFLTIGVAIGDFYLGCPTTLFGKAVYSGDETNNRVFQYYYAAKGKNDLLCEEWEGACHGADLIPVFGAPLRYPEKHYPEEADLSRRMISAFSHFAKHGELPAQEGIEWLSYYTVNENVVQPYYEWTHRPKQLGNFGIDLKAVECEKLWKFYIERQ